MQRTHVKIFPDPSAVPRDNGRPFIGISLNSLPAESLRKVFDYTARTFGQFDLLIGDFLERHNYQSFEHASRKAAIDQAMRDGARMQVRLERLLASAGYANAQMISARSLQNHPSFNERLADFHRQYLGNNTLKMLIDSASEGFLARKHPSASLDGRIKTHCVEYQLEELVLFELLVEAGHRIFVYPGGQLPVMKGIVAGELPGVSKTLEALSLVEIRIFR